MDSLFGLVFPNIILFVIPAAILGRQKGQGANCAVLAFFFGPLGPIIGLLLPDLKKKEEEKLRYQEQQALLKKQIALQEEALRMNSGRGMNSTQPPPSSNTQRKQKMFRVAKDRQEFGELEISEIHDLINSNDLSLDDFYLDPKSNTWVALNQHPQLTNG